MAILDFIAFILRIINGVIVPLIFAIAFVAFLVGVVRNFIAGSDKDRQSAHKMILYSIIGFFLMLSIWGIVHVVVGTFGFDRSGRPPLPYFGGSNSSIFGNW